jgi:hypothetical protein
VREVGGNAWSVDDIIETKLEDVVASVGLKSHVVREEPLDLGNQGVCLEQKSQRLTNTALRH